MSKSTITYWNPLSLKSSSKWQPIKGLEELAEELTLSIDEKITNAEAGTENIKDLYSGLCNALTLLYDMRLKMLDSLAPENYELDLRFSDSLTLVELIEKLENYLYMIEDKHSDKINKTEMSPIKGDFERKKLTYEQKLDESFD